MVRLISRQRGSLAALKLTKLFGINDFPAAKDSGKVLIIIIYCYLIIRQTRIHRATENEFPGNSKPIFRSNPEAKKRLHKLVKQLAG